MLRPEAITAARVEKILAIVEEATKGMTEPMVGLLIKKYGRDPYLILISCLLSLRSRDVMTYKICQELFKHGRTPQELLKIPQQELEALLKPIGFYRKKSQIIKEVSQELIERFDSKVPGTESELLSINHVGPKTANLVLGEAFGVPAICVDTHVHRLSNRLGLVKTKTPEQTEFELKKIIPQERWIQLNHLLVMWGQNICVPLSPFCSKCALLPVCPQVGVTKNR